MRSRACSIGALILALAFCAWWRAYTFAPAARGAIGADLWPWAVGATEPLDCDEAVYAYIGKRLLAGDAMYRDLTENKPPLGYFLYAAAVGAGGYTEGAIRAMSLPYVLATVALLWWVALRLGGPLAAAIAAWAYAFASADPYLFGNGSNMEHFVNAFAVAGLACMLRGSAAGAGLFAGLSALVKQVAGAPLLVYAGAIALDRSRPRIRRLLWLAAGFATPWAIALGILAAQGAGRDAFEDIVRYGGALATDTPPDPNSPPGWARWLTGNADPTPQGKPWDAGGLPWPFGSTNYYVWWGAGLWPLWLASALSWPYLAFGPRLPGRRLLAAWVAACWLQVTLPGLYWQHYYLLPLPGAVLSVALALGDSLAAARSRRLALIPAAALSAAIAGSLAIQVRDYAMVPPEQITARFKGGAQWVALRKLGASLKARAEGAEDPRLFVWGWQSPLYFYSGLDGVTRQVFVDPLMKNFADKGHPRTDARVARTLRDLREHPPDFVFCGDPPFPALRAFLEERYVPGPEGVAPQGQGLWVRSDR